MQRIRDCIELPTLASRLDEGVAARAAIGLVVLATDQTLESEFRRLVPVDGIGVYCSRVYNDADITPDTLRAIGERITPSAGLLLPGSPLDVVAFGCTSATMALGEDAIFERIRRVRPGVACTTPITAALAALAALKVTRIGVLTPYDTEVNVVVRGFLEGRGVDVRGFATFKRLDDREAARISLDSIAQGVKALTSTVDVDAVFISCTSLRLVERIEAIEAAAGVPVTSSDHALAWHCLRLANIHDRIPGAGRLFEI